MKTSVVVSLMPESRPPKTPAMHIGRSAEQIIRSLSVSLRSTPSSVTKGVPSAQVRTTTSRPSIFAASKACSGCPSSKSTKLVMSTRLFLGLMPAARRQFCIHSGEGPILQPETVTPT